MDLYPKKTLKLPVRIIIAYLAFTLFLYAFGPFRWVTYRPVLFWSLNVLYVFSLWFGWNVSLRINTYRNNKEWNSNDERALTIIMKPLVLINIIFEFLYAMRKFRFVSFNVFDLFRHIIIGMSNMGLSYSKFQTGIDDITGASLIGGNILTILNLLFAFFSFNIVILEGVLFKYFKLPYKILIVFTYVFISLEYLSTGTNIGAFRIVLVIIVILAINYARNQKKLSKMHFDKKKVFFIVFSLSGILVVILIFNKIMQSRGGILQWQTDSYNVGGIGLDRNSIFFKVLPEDLYMLFISISSYLTQGYYGMSLSLELNWEPGFGLGHNKAIQSLLIDILNPIYLNTYQHRLDSFGWDENIQWHTLYTWFANDFTFYGVILIVFFIGFVFCNAYTDSLVFNNPFAKAVVYYFVLMCIFIPCNNQVFQSTYMLFGFVGSLVFWIASKKGVRLIFHRFF